LEDHLFAPTQLLPRGSVLLGELVVPDGVTVMHIDKRRKRKRVISVGYIWDKTANTIWYGRCVYLRGVKNRQEQVGDQKKKPKPAIEFNEFTHGHTAITRLFRRCVKHVFDEPVTPEKLESFFSLMGFKKA